MTLALARTQAEFRLLYACRRRQDVAFGDELRERIGDRLEVFLDEEGEKVDLAAEIAQLAPGGEFYVCGPIGMLEAAKSEWRHSGRPVDKLRFETFGNSGRFASQSFSVRIPRLGRVVEVPKNQTMLDALEAAGIDMIFDCRRGECGLCASTSSRSTGSSTTGTCSSATRRRLRTKTLHLRVARRRRQHHGRHGRPGRLTWVPGPNEGGGRDGVDGEDRRPFGVANREGAARASGTGAARRSESRRTGVRAADGGAPGRLADSGRMALVRLEEEGLLEAIPSGGFAVKAFTEREVFEAIEIRGTLEGLASRRRAGREPLGPRSGGGLPRRDRRRRRARPAGDRHLPLRRTECAVPRHPDRFRRQPGPRAPARSGERAAVRLAERPGPGAVAIAGIASHPDRGAGPAPLRPRGDRATGGSRAEAIMREHARIAHRNLEWAFANQREMDLVPGSALIKRRVRA